MKKLERIIHITRQFENDGWGTRESTVHHLAQESVSRGLESLIFCTSAGSSPGIEKIGAVPVHRHSFSVPDQTLSPARQLYVADLPNLNLFSQPLFAALKRERHASIFHTHVRGRLGAIVRTAAKSRKIPYLVSLHGEYLEESQVKPTPSPSRSLWTQWIDTRFNINRVLQDASAILCLGSEEEALVRKKFPKKRIYSTPPGVDLAIFKYNRPDPFRRAFSFDSDDKIILCVAAIAATNNQHLLLRAFAEFRKLCPDYKLVLIGPVKDAAYQETLYAEATWLGVREGLLILNEFRLDDPLLPGAYSAATFFVLPATSRPYPQVIIEAWAAGTPVITTSVGGISGFTKNGENVLWIKPGDNRDLIEKMVILARDQGLRELLAQSGTQEVNRQYDWSAVNYKTTLIYEEILAAFR